MAGSYRLIVRARSRVERHRFGDLDTALAELESRGRELERNADLQEEGGKLMRRFEPVQQVFGRLELRGRGLSGGVDVRGDGSSEAFTGRMKRTLVVQRRGESPYDALRRALAG